MQRRQTTYIRIQRILIATVSAAKSALALMAARHRDRRILDRLNSAELEDIGLSRAENGVISFRAAERDRPPSIAADFHPDLTDLGASRTPAKSTPT